METVLVSFETGQLKALLCPAIRLARAAAVELDVSSSDLPQSAKSKDFPSAAA